MRFMAVWALVVGVILGVAAAAAARQPVFEASYELLLDGTGFYSGNDLSVGNAVMSGDGSTILAYTYYYYGSERNLFFIDTATGARVEIPLSSSGTWGVVSPSMAISDDGSVAFIVDTVADSLFRVSGSTMVEILDKDDWTAINGVWGVRTTAAGDAVYFEEDNDDLWRLSAAGGTPERVIDDAVVPRNGGSGRRVSGFDLSADGSTIVFTLLGYDAGGGTVIDPEIFVLESGAFRQLTSDTDTSWKTWLELSGDGSTAVIYDQVTDWWTAIDVATGAATLFYPTGYNVAGAVMPADGSRIFFNDSGTRGGHLIRRDGSDGIDLFPSPPIYISAAFFPQMSDDGSRVSFVRASRMLYTGVLWPTAALPPGPTVASIALDPEAVPYDDPSTVVVLTATISDPDGLADIASTSIDHLLGGEIDNYWDDVPVYFSVDPRDDGGYPDATAGDGVYSTSGQCAGQFPTIRELTLRVGAQDDAGNVYVRDTVLYVCPPEGCTVFDDGFESGSWGAWSGAAP